MGIDLIIIQCVVSVVGFCGEDRVQVDAVEAHGGDVVEVFRNAPQRPAQCGKSFPAAGECTLSVGKAVRENVVHNGIPGPFRNGQPVCPVVKGKLEIICPCGGAHHFVAVPIVAQGFSASGQFKVIGDAVKIRFQPQFIPVKVPVLPYLWHGQAEKAQLGGHGGTIRIVEFAGFRLASAGTQTENVMGFVQRKGKFAEGSVIDR